MRKFININDFKFFKDKLFYVDSSFSLVLEGKQIIDKNENPSSLSVLGDFLLFYENKNGKIFSKEGKIIDSFSGFYPYLLIENKDIMLCHENTEEFQYLTGRIYSNQKFIWKKPTISLKTHYNKDFYFIHHAYPERQTIFCLNIETGNVRWQYTLDENFDLVIDTPREKRTIQAFFTRICGDYGGYIWCTLYHDYLLRFDMETGDIQSWSLMDMIDDDQYRTIESCIYFRDILAQAHLNAEQGKIYGLHQKTFLEIDISTGAPKATVHDISETLTENGIEKAEYTPSLVWKQDKVYFCNNGSSTMDHNIGRLDIKTKKIDLVGKTQEKFVVDGMPGHYLLPYNQVMECSDDKVYILTKHGGDLCIYDIDEQKGTIS
jgi:hypothetical protein